MATTPRASDSEMMRQESLLSLETPCTGKLTFSNFLIPSFVKTRLKMPCESSISILISGSLSVSILSLPIIDIPPGSFEEL